MSTTDSLHPGVITLYTDAQPKDLIFYKAFIQSPEIKNRPTGPSTSTMCHVHRVTNTCGHRNDHVLLTCRTAKSILECSPESPSYSYSHRGSLLSMPISRRLLDAVDAGSITVHGGFHACTEPYCRRAIVRELRSAEGFACMVPGCGRVG